MTKNEREVRPRMVKFVSAFAIWKLMFVEYWTAWEKSSAPTSRMSSSLRMLMLCGISLSGRFTLLIEAVLVAW